MSEALLGFLGILTKPLTEAPASGTQPSQQEALLTALRANQAELRAHLRAAGGPGEQEALGLLQDVRAQVPWPCGDSEDVTWDFVQEGLALVLSLARHLGRLTESFSQASPAAGNRRTAEAAPPLPPDVLSVAQQKTFGAGLQFMVTLGLCPYLAPGVGLALRRRSAFGATVEAAVRRDVPPAASRRLLITTMTLLELSELPALSTLIFTRHLGDIMAALCQLGYQPLRPQAGSTDQANELSVEERDSCRRSLQGLLGKVYQPIVIRELLLLQGGPKQARSAVHAEQTLLAQAPAWLRRLCGQLLSERLMQSNGVQSVVRAVLEGSAGGDSDWQKCDAVARILVTCPQQAISAEDYYSQVCPQVLQLLHFKDKLTALQFQRVATRAALTMLQERPEFTQRLLLTPLLAPLRRCALGESVEELELSRCVDDVYKVCVVGNSPSEVLLRILGDVVPALFTLFCFTKKNASHLRAPCQEVLLWYLSQLDTSPAISVLRQLCALDGDVVGVAPGWQFSPGSEGGAKLSPREPISDEDELLYEKVCGDQWRVQCLAELLLEMKNCDLPGDFFLELLQGLTSWAVEEEEEEGDEPEVDTSTMTLLELEQQLIGRAMGRGRRLALLQVLAVLCEVLPHTLLLRRPAQAMEFIAAMLQRACVCLEKGCEGPVEAETLRMGMGLVATMLSAPTQLSPEEYSALSKVLPHLQQISQQHPEVVIQELASDLRATIATRGAYRPDTVNHAGQRSAHRTGGRRDDLMKALSAHTRTDTPPASATHTNTTKKPLITEVSPITGASSQPKPTEETPDGHHPAERGAPGRHEPCQTVSECLLEACDPDVPTRGVALRTLTCALQRGQKEALDAQEKVLMIFLENLEHEDTFVYLSAIQGLAVLADAFPEKILQRLLVEYEAGPPHHESSLETRLKIGEVLMRSSRAMGDLAPHYGRPLIGVFLRAVRDKDSSVRTSSLSNLGELCQRLNFSLGPLAQELSVCLTSLIKTEKEAEVRRAAVHVITLLLRGLSDKTTEVLGDVLLDLYRALKLVARADRDEVAVLHAQLALGELDEVMRRFMFPEQKLQKKIVVLP
ncbi:transport and Golgi organization protein 6 homolog [Denticeps clupeoides]|uniref:Transport and Golgi organization protein 6 homolog n=1 Tax=Denticeps clupeoides TaxID=299321 RepID=A0AAY4DQQ6_9TELE|nr:transport and Golgi organization protein 6 homolog [Denticeps clupeoides]